MLAFTIGMHFNTDIALLGNQSKGIAINYQGLDHNEHIENT